MAVWIATCKQGLQSTWLVQAAMGQRKGPFPFRKAGLAVESCVMAALHSTVFRSIKSWASQRDTQMSCAMRGLQEGGGNPLGRRLSQHSLRVCGVPEHLWAVDLGGVAERLSHLQHCRCPLEMMKCLQDANDAILIAVAGASGTGKGQVRFLLLLWTTAGVPCKGNCTSVFSLCGGRGGGGFFA